MKIARFAGAVAVCVLLQAGQGWAVDVAFINGGDFNSASNWSDGMLPGAVPGDLHLVQDNLVATYAGGATSMGKLVVSDSSPGTLLMSGGDLTVGGGNESFVIGRSLNGNGLVELSGGAILRTADGDSSFVGQRDRGVLRVGAGASVLSPGSVWRVGQSGPLIDSGLAGDGLIDVQGVFQAQLIFLGVDDGDGELRISGNGSVTLSDNLVPNVNTFYPNRSSLVNMVGSSASLVVNNLESENGPAQVRNAYLFQADASGVSPITALGAVNISNNRLEVDLTSYLGAAPVLTLFDAPPERIFGVFAEVNIVGDASGLYQIVYDAAAGGTGDIQLVRGGAVPEPAALGIMLVGLLVGAARWRTASRV